MKESINNFGELFINLNIIQLKLYINIENYVDFNKIWSINVKKNTQCTVFRTESGGNN